MRMKITRLIVRPGLDQEFFGIKYMKQLKEHDVMYTISILSLYFITIDCEIMGY
jgi:hypothetical protein